MVSSIVIDHLRKTQPQSTGIGFIYCIYKNSAAQTLYELMAGLLRTFVENSGAMFPGLEAIYDKHVRQGTRPSVEEVRSLLESKMNDHDRNFIVVDALDECEKSEMNRLLEGLRRLLSNGIRSKIHVMLTSRPTVQIEDYFDNFQRIDITAHDSDIQKYLYGHMSQLGRCVRSDVGLQGEIVETICKVVQGMSVRPSILQSNMHANSIRPGFFLLGFIWTLSLANRRSKPFGVL